MLKPAALIPALMVAAACLVPPCAAQPTITQQDLSVDLADPHIATQADLARFNHALAAFRAAMRKPNDIPRMSKAAQAWIRLRASFWVNGGYWILGAPLVWAGPAVVVVGRPSVEEADFFNKTADQVAAFMASHFGLPRPKYAFVVRTFSEIHEKTPLPRSMVQLFENSKDQLLQVSGVTLPPRFVILPTDLLPQPGQQPTVYLDKNQHVVSRGAFHDVVMHEFVHAHVHALMAEDLLRHHVSGIAPGLPQWFDEGLAVYVTEKLMVEPGTAPASYYEYSAPFHYIEDKWGSDVLSKFVYTAIYSGIDPALAQIGVSDSDRFLNAATSGKASRSSTPPKPLSVKDLRDQAELYANRPNWPARLRGLGLFVGFLLLVVAAVLTPAAVGWFYGTWMMQFPEVAGKRLKAAFDSFEKAEGLDRRRLGAQRFLAIHAKAPKKVQDEWASQASGSKQFLETYGQQEPEEEEERPQRRHRRYMSR